MKLMITFFSIFILLIFLNYFREYHFSNTKINFKKVSPKQLELSEIIQKRDLEITLVKILNDQKVKKIFKNKKKPISVKDKVASARDFATNMVMTQKYRNLKTFFPTDKVAQKIWLIILAISPENKIPYKENLKYAYTEDLKNDKSNSSQVIISIITALPERDFFDVKLQLITLYSMVSTNYEKSKRLTRNLIHQINQIEKRELYPLYLVSFNHYLHFKRQLNEKGAKDIIQIIKKTRESKIKNLMKEKFIHHFPLQKEFFFKEFN